MALVFPATRSEAEYLETSGAHSQKKTNTKVHICTATFSMFA